MPLSKRSCWFRQLFTQFFTNKTQAKEQTKTNKKEALCRKNYWNSRKHAQLNRTQRAPITTRFCRRGVCRVTFSRLLSAARGFSNRVHILLLLSAIATTRFDIWLIALGLHVNETTLRVLSAIELLEQPINKKTFYQPFRIQKANSNPKFGANFMIQTNFYVFVTSLLLVFFRSQSSVSANRLRANFRDAGEVSGDLQIASRKNRRSSKPDARNSAFPESLVIAKTPIVYMKVWATKIIRNKSPSQPIRNSLSVRQPKRLRRFPFWWVRTKENCLWMTIQKNICRISKFRTPKLIKILRFVICFRIRRA